MFRKYLHRKGTLKVLILGGAVACNYSEVELPTSATRNSQASRDPIASVWTVDDEWARIAADSIPGFAGYYIDANGSVVVETNNLSKQRDALGYVHRQVSSAQKPTQNFVVREVAYDFANLKKWRDTSIDLMKRSDVITLDINERENKIEFGVLSAAATTEVTTVLRQRGIPDDAFSVSIRGAIKPKQLLSDHLPNSKDVRGGFMIAAYNNGYCSLGFNALAPTLSWSHVWITASHCSTTRYTLDYEDWYQPYYAASPTYGWLGWEILDPGAPGCYVAGPMALPSCRHSDAAIYEFSDDTSGTVGYIGHPFGPPGIGAFGSTTIDSVTPSWRIVNRIPHSAVSQGDYFNKVGASSGWTRGYVTNTCVIVADGGVSHLCQYIAQIFSIGGDSGSPIFHDEANTQFPAGTDVYLFGILWGGATQFESVISPLDMMEVDFGLTLKVCASSVTPSC